MQALLAFKQGLVDDDNRLLSWGREVQNKDCCQWAGVYCSNHTDHVVKLELEYESLQGTISPKLVELHHLEYLNLGFNNFNGSIPDVFGNMSSLAYLSLSGSRLKGGIPNSFAKLCRLRELHLDGNSLSGQFSDFIDILSKCVQNTLEILDISLNHGIMGSVPDLTNFLSLKYLLLRGNKLSGRIPENIGQMSKLEVIDFGRNSLEGVISEIHFSKLFNLMDLSLSSNSLVLNFSFDWVPPFQLESIMLRSCKMGPFFPKWLQTQKKVLFLDISDNGITDTLPSWLSHGLYSTDISQNQIRGTLGNWKSTFPPQLNVSWNQSEGPIPSMLSEIYLLFDL
ncbi:PREDICTED: LRR receptor-like serine/threonine-protein kinase ERL1 [Prunus mume]|uniref:LRR receptor-like serine/threonine-protein kinase ERL1 n=1 Tax=Prunus mume TaxID=102107 RepID=A0ABM0P176_PRUMU|nr:PREDICTED: LRR receptor-like serine/threonine-protein kinase ERL1 [Prunus mume]